MRSTFEELRKIRSDLQGRLSAQPGMIEAPKTLYHYTDAAGLLGIVTSGAVWATHSAYLNDASELQYAMRLMQNVVEEKFAGAAQDSWEHECFLAVLRDESESGDSAIGLTDSNSQQQFVACFSEAEDRLSQWRGYGKTIGGYALGFPVDHLREMEKRFQARPGARVAVSFGRCWYDEDAQKDLLEHGLRCLLHHLKTLSSHVPSREAQLDAKEEPLPPHIWLPGVVNAIPRAVSPYFKAPSFKEEQEWRLVVRLRIRTPNDGRIQFRAGAYSLAPYIALPVVWDDAVALSKVVVGPTPLPANALAAATLLLRKSATSGRKITCANVVPSVIPFRRV